MTLEQQNTIVEYLRRLAHFNFDDFDSRDEAFRMLHFLQQNALKALGEDEN